jgi:molecular chaperone GrpE
LPAVADLVAQLAERTADLQRLKAEYDNYRRRVDRDRAVAGDLATARTFAALLPTLDDIGRARAHGELEGGFRSVADGLEKALGALGLESFGQPGDQFDPTVHEAVLHSYSPDVTEPTCVEVFSLGWRYAERVLRPAQVAVAEPAEPADETGSGADPEPIG